MNRQIGSSLPSPAAGKPSQKCPTPRPREHFARGAPARPLPGGSSGREPWLTSLARGAPSSCLSNEPVNDGRCTKDQLFLKPSSDTLVPMVLGRHGQQRLGRTDPFGCTCDVRVGEGPGTPLWAGRGRRAVKEGMETEDPGVKRPAMKHEWQTPPET